MGDTWELSSFFFFFTFALSPKISAMARIFLLGKNISERKPKDTAESNCSGFTNCVSNVGLTVGICGMKVSVSDVPCGGWGRDGGMFLMTGALQTYFSSFIG